MSDRVFLIIGGSVSKKPEHCMHWCYSLLWWHYLGGLKIVRHVWILLDHVNFLIRITRDRKMWFQNARFCQSDFDPRSDCFRHCRDRQKTQAVIDDIYAKDPGCRFILLRWGWIAWRVSTLPQRSFWTRAISWMYWLTTLEYAVLRPASVLR